MIVRIDGDTYVVNEVTVEDPALRADVDRLRRALAAALPPVPPAPQPLTRRQREVLDAIIAFRLRHRVSPKQRELAEHFGVSLNAIACVLDRLEARGWIRIHRRCMRGIEVLHDGTTSITLHQVESGAS